MDRAVELVRQRFGYPKPEPEPEKEGLFTVGPDGLLELTSSRKTGPKTHDYRKRYWGHAVTIHEHHGGKSGYKTLRVSGFGYGVRVKDWIVLQGVSGYPMRYRVEQIKHLMDPQDMWWATLEFDPEDVKGA